MTDKNLIQALLKGAYLCPRHSMHKSYGYGLYTGNKILVEVISNAQFRRFKDVFKKHSNSYTFNLNLVRQMHGKALPKIMYKHLKNKAHETERV